MLSCYLTVSLIHLHHHQLRYRCQTVTARSTAFDILAVQKKQIHDLEMLQHSVYAGVVARPHILEHFVYEFSRVASNFYFG